MSDRRALLSVSDRTGLSELARALVEMGFEILSTGGTAEHLAKAAIRVTSVSDVTAFPEVFGGRVKTLHPALFGGILFDRSEKTHRTEAAANGIRPIDLVVVNLYPFEETLAEFEAAGGAGDAEVVPRLIEKIDVGGPSLLRAAAKNHAHVTVVCDPADYENVVAEMKANGGATSFETRRRLAAKVFRRTAAYDAAIARWFTPRADAAPFPERLTPTFTLVSPLRYGENPHQKGALYRDQTAPAAALARFEILQGKELSYNNLLDADAALFAARSAGERALAIIKHRIPSGLAAAETAAEAFQRAWDSDPVAGFGGVVAYTGTIDGAGARAMTERFLEVVVSHGVADDAREVFSKKPNLRVLVVEREGAPRPRFEARAVDGGLLLQEADVLHDDEKEWKVVTKRAPTDDERAALSFAWRAVRAVVSNAVVVADRAATFGIGGGRTSRVDACRDAVGKAGSRAQGAAAASDAFFPFSDGLEVLAGAGVRAVVQPGGSVKDGEVIAAADARDIAMVFTGKRHFRH